MINKKNNGMLKGVYKHNQPEGYFSVRHYIIINQKGKRCLLLRFENELSSEVNAVEFRVYQLNGDGEHIGTSTIKYKGLSVQPGQLCSSQDGIVIKNECVDFVVQMRYVISQKTKYVFKKDIVTAHYDRRGYDDCVQAYRDGSVYGTRTKVTFRRKIFSGALFFSCMAFLAFVIATAGTFLEIILKLL